VESVHKAILVDLLYMFQVILTWYLTSVYNTVQIKVMVTFDIQIQTC